MCYPAFTVAQGNGSRISEFVYPGRMVKNGKPELNGLPSAYVGRKKKLQR